MANADVQISPPETPTIRLRGVSRWYGEVLGVNRVTVDIHPGITGLVGPNGSGKSTLMNVTCGLLRPGQGEVQVLGRRVWDNPEVQAHLGYCTQVDHFYENFTGRRQLASLLALRGEGRTWTERTVDRALALVGLEADQHRRLRTYSKGMRQRLKIALALAPEPNVLVLDEPFNGLDPVGRHEMMRLFAEYARSGRTVLISSHILHEIEQMTNRVLMMSNGYVMAEGEVRQVRDSLQRHPFHVVLRSAESRRLAALLLENDSVLSLEFTDERTLTLTTRQPDALFLELNRAVAAEGIDVDLVTLADENVESIYQYLSGREHH